MTTIFYDFKLQRTLWLPVHGPYSMDNSTPSTGLFIVLRVYMSYAGTHGCTDLSSSTVSAPTSSVTSPPSPPRAHPWFPAPGPVRNNFVWDSLAGQPVSNAAIDTLALSQPVRV